MYICFKIVRNGIAFPKQISRIDKNSRKAHKKNTLSGCRRLSGYQKRNEAFKIIPV